MPREFPPPSFHAPAPTLRAPACCGSLTRRYMLRSFAVLLDWRSKPRWAQVMPRQITNGAYIKPQCPTTPGHRRNWSRIRRKGQMRHPINMGYRSFPLPRGLLFAQIGRKLGLLIALPSDECTAEVAAYLGDRTRINSPGLQSGSHADRKKPASARRPHSRAARRRGNDGRSRCALLPSDRGSTPAEA